MFLKVRPNLSTTDDFISELLVEYSLILFSFNKFLYFFIVKLCSFVSP